VEVCFWEVSLQVLVAGIQDCLAVVDVEWKPVFTTEHALCCEYTAKSAGFVLNQPGNVVETDVD